MMKLLSQLFVIFGVVVLSLAGCTKKQLYNTVQQTNESRCKTKVGPEREQCLAELNKKDFQEYESERKSIVNNNSR